MYEILLIPTTYSVFHLDGGEYLVGFIDPSFSSLMMLFGRG
jgi:hypothetical protein